MSCEHLLLSALLRKVNDWLRPPGSKEDQPFEAEAWCVWCHETTPWRQLFGKTYILNPPRWLSMVSALDIHSIRNSWMPQPQYSYCQASRLAGGLMSKKSLEKAAWIHRTSFFLSYDNHISLQVWIHPTKVGEGGGFRAWENLQLFEKSTSLDSFDSTEALPLCAASLWRCHGGTGYALERGKAAMAGNTWKATLPGRCYLSFWVETLMQMKAHPSWENIGFHDVFDVPFQYMPIFFASMPSFSSSTTCSTGWKNCFIDPGAFWEKIEGVEFCRGESVVLRWFWIFEPFDLEEAKMI